MGCRSRNRGEIGVLVSGESVQWFSTGVTSLYILWCYDSLFSHKNINAWEPCIISCDYIKNDYIIFLLKEIERNCSQKLQPNQNSRAAHFLGHDPLRDSLKLHKYLCFSALRLHIAGVFNEYARSKTSLIFHREDFFEYNNGKPNFFWKHWGRTSKLLPQSRSRRSVMLFIHSLFLFP